MLKKYLFLLFVFSPNILFAYDCSKYQYDVDVNIIVNSTDAKIEKSSEELIGKLGYTEPKMSYSLLTNTVVIPVHGGNCISLRGLDVNINQDFRIVIDKKLKEKSCAYNIVFKHEQDHVNVYKNIIKDNVDNIKKSIIDGLKSFHPVFSQTEYEDFPGKISQAGFAKKIVSDIMKKIEDENQKIDERGDSYHIWKCDDFYQEMKHNSNISID